MRKALTIILSVLLVVPMFVSCNQDDIIDDLFEPTYSIKVAGTIGHGTVSADKTNAHEGDTVTLTATPAEGYELSAFSVTDDKANAITVTDGSFTMPADNVTVGATFSKTAETINQEAAAAVTTKIGAIGTVSYTAESKAKIDEARSAYDALTSEQKELVTNYSTLTTAESTYSTLKAAAEQQHSITLTGPYSNFTLVMEYQEGDTWNDMATKYPDYIKIYNKWPGFHTDGFIYDKATGNNVLSTDVIDSNKTYEIQ